MKKIIAILLASAMMLTLAACGGSAKPSGTASEPVAENALEILNKVWDSYKEEDKFPVAGGDMDEANLNMEGPGNYGIEDKEALDQVLLLPASSADKIDNAASMMHMMNANTFTCGAFRVKNAADVKGVTEDIQKNFENRQWICGMPDKIVIATLGNYVVSFFGETEIVETFKANLTAAYTAAEIAVEQTL